MVNRKMVIQRPPALDASMTMQDALVDRRASYTPEMCLRCDAPMRIKTIVPTMFVHCIDDVVYVCPSCGIQSRRIIRRTGYSAS